MTTRLDSEISSEGQIQTLIQYVAGLEKFFVFFASAVTLVQNTPDIIPVKRSRHLAAKEHMPYNQEVCDEYRSMAVSNDCSYLLSMIHLCFNISQCSKTHLVNVPAKKKMHSDSRSLIGLILMDSQKN